MEILNKANRIRLLSLRTPQMRAFHFSWFAFHICFFGWFGIAPLMAVVREDLNLTQTQIGNTIIASVLITVIVRLLIGVLCDRIGPRKTYTGLLVLGSIPVMSIGFANSFETFLLARLAIGAIGASFVITQYHTTMMFAPNVVGTANATSAGWGNLGGGTTQIVMPLIFSGLLMLGVSETLGWRLAMVVPGVVMFATGIGYWLFTQDAPNGNFDELRARGELPPANGENSAGKSFMSAAKDIRVWALFVVYAICFGVELTINNIAAIYFFDHFDLTLATAGMIAGLFGLMNVFARTLGGVFSDLFARNGGLKGRVRWLFIALICEGIALVAFSQMHVLSYAIGIMLVFSLFVQMAEGATYGVVPFINKKALGAVAGIVGAGGNVGAVAAAFLFRSEAITYQQGLFYLGLIVLVLASCALLVRFSDETEAEEAEAYRQAVGEDTGAGALSLR
ncbi:MULTISPECIES: NarK family nitrate/nitrite MFS transporter [Halomonadaceae]|uniref:NarK family nitrate/nitrite MFS transporter n=1 Tax=Halomonadaceae TaxID=28256 RepID=UPI00089E4A13|nr:MULTISPECIES: NarK family nitrate/nitrite MFS transporter [Halomonas]MCE8039154.1 NarK family nitrate/nitrite MFS transporter [Halomonas sp. MCCC 1A11062]NIC36518.1 NarK family nitrate/nitrite MFS transporter [Halomonas desiderata]SEF89770.1 MFS transporter, NNP family, nitrate/nitrite transporter [Halomonas desiderata]